MNVRAVLVCTGLLMALAAPAAQAQAPSHTPVLDRVAARIVEKYQTSSCEQLAQQRQAPRSANKQQAEQRVGQMLRQDPAARAAFVSKVAAPIADKMIQCGFIP
jgi:hypothetical protein